MAKETNLPKGINFQAASKFPTGFENLSDREKKYFKMMNAKSGVLYITSAPGYAKSAIMRSIAKQMGFQYFDIRLSMVDETDVGLFPTIGEEEVNGSTQKMLSHVAPKWAYMANVKPTIIHFEELNRSTLSVRNAALQMLLEREIGAFFKFNENVMMCASGNLGEEDGTDVEEFDQALNNRLIHIEHTLPFPEWVERYANENVCPVIVQFLKTHTEHYYKKPDERNQRNKAYATPRSWTFLSDYIFQNFGELTTRKDNDFKEILDEAGNPKMFKKFPSVRAWINDIKEIGHGYVGPSNARFIRYCEDTLKITLDDVLDRYDDIESDIKTFNRDKKSELLANMKERRISQLKVKQLENLTRFLGTISDDEIVGYILHVLDTEYNLSEENKENKMAEKFLADKRFNKFRDAILKHVDDEDDKKK
jgi:flagellar biosynthesis chaperone FliJ